MWGANIGTTIYTWLRGEEVGRDRYGNRYFREKGGGRVHPDSIRKERRWVIFKDEVEASRIPPEWHAWLHHTLEDHPPDGGSEARPWQKPHLPNLSGTEEAYLPPGHTLKGGKRAPGTGDYEPWVPD